MWWLVQMILLVIKNIQFVCMVGESLDSVNIVIAEPVYPGISS